MPIEIEPGVEEDMQDYSDTYDRDYADDMRIDELREGL